MPSGNAVESSRFRTSMLVQDGYRALTRAAAAVTCGAAIDVPLQYAINPPLAHTDPVGRAVERISTRCRDVDLVANGRKARTRRELLLHDSTLSTTSAW